MFENSQKALRAALLSALALVPKAAQALTFDHKIETTLSSGQLWDLLTSALGGNMTNGFWPTRYSIISGQVEENGIVTEVVFGSSTVRYRLSNLIPGERLTYSPIPGEAMQGFPDHPKVGAQAIQSWITFPPTSVRRKSRPWNR